MDHKTFKCPGCGSSALEAYKDEEHVYIICENCAEKYKISDVKHLPPELERIKEQEESILANIMPTILVLLVITVIFAFATRIILEHMGVMV